ncbi:MAG: thioredoxin-dependent thiol peroxidase [bacterium]|nr:thioredoxin-dependent thiol peroxidase [Myxococcales bacterium]MCB9542686.1 thioredoxin-dependent thiol peroxidase [Myxococcales bacterium]MCB9552862.1 thioredoxin-dependent thiol peroxidase [Myxococcales bacterium]
MSIEAGQPAPDFTLPSDTEGDVTLSGLIGRPVVLYFYPKDDTPGCTTEACDFRDRMARVAAAGATVLGVSRDSVKRHAGFRSKYSLNFPLLSDSEGEVHRLYGAWGEKKMYGRTTVGPIRTTVLIDAQGRVSRVWSSVKVKGHADAVLEALAAL